MKHMFFIFLIATMALHSIWAGDNEEYKRTWVVTEMRAINKDQLDVTVTIALVDDITVDKVKRAIRKAALKKETQGKDVYWQFKVPPCDSELLFDGRIVRDTDLKDISTGTVLHLLFVPRFQRPKFKTLMQKYHVNYTT